MGNQNNTQEKEENKSEEIQKEEAPSDTHSNKQNIEDINSQNNQDNQDILNNNENHLIIKEVKNNNNEDETNNQIEQRRVKYHIRKINQENQNKEGEGDFNQLEQFENEEIKEGIEHNNMEQIYQNNSYSKDENNSRFIINNINSANTGYNYNKNNNIEPGFIYRDHYQTQFHSNIPQYMSFQKKTKTNYTGNIKTRLNVEKNDHCSELIEIPRDKYSSYMGRETVFIGDGMNTGEYLFKGQGIIITQKGNVENKIEISEDEILKEINARKNKNKKAKKKKLQQLEKQETSKKILIF